MTVSVLVPWRPGCPWREAAWAWVQDQYATTHPDWEIVTGTSPDGPFSRSQAILDAASRATGDMLVVADSDVWCDPAEAILEADDHGWAIPHLLVHRLSEESTRHVLAGANWRGLPLSRDNTQDRKPYEGFETGTLVVLRRNVLELAPPDPRFVGWGQEDQAWSSALRCLVGPPHRGNADLVHLWHPPQPRKTRAVGSSESFALWRRYALARNRPARMRDLINEGRRAC